MYEQNVQPVSRATSPQDYQRLGLSTEQVAPWEDGMRTDGMEGSYEWWYFDSALDDGSTLVITFYTKPYGTPHVPLKPYVRFLLDTSDAHSVHKVYHGDVQRFSASREQCDVRIDNNYFKGDLQTYQIHIEIDDMVADLAIRRRVPSWRPGTGYTFFGTKQDKYIGWVVAVPLGEVEASMTINGQTRTLHGNCYHDHNWGNVTLLNLYNHWYWARAQVGDYAFITTRTTTEQIYGYAPITAFLLTKNGKIIADDESKITFSELDRSLDVQTGKPFGNQLRFVYQDGAQQYVITYHQERIILRDHLIDSFSPAERAKAEQAGFDGAYLRFSGPCTLEHIEGEQVVEAVSAPAIWEMMYPGKVPDDAKTKR